MNLILILPHFFVVYCYAECSLAAWIWPFFRLCWVTRHSIFKCEWMRNEKFTYTLNTTTSNRRHIIINAEWKKDSCCYSATFRIWIGRKEYEKKKLLLSTKRKNKMVEYAFVTRHIFQCLYFAYESSPHQTHNNPSWNEHNMTCTKKSNNNDF